MIDRLSPKQVDRKRDFPPLFHNSFPHMSGTHRHTLPTTPSGIGGGSRFLAYDFSGLAGSDFRRDGGSSIAGKLRLQERFPLDYS